MNKSKVLYKDNWTSNTGTKSLKKRSGTYMAGYDDVVIKKSYGPGNPGG
jgi:hypothetical protein